MSVRNYVVLSLVFALVLNSVDAFTLTCPSSPVYFEDNTLSFSVSIVTTDGTLTNTYADVNLITPVGTYEQNVLIGESVANDEVYTYAVPLTLLSPSFDGNVEVALSVNGETNSCSFVAYDYPRVVFIPSSDVTNAEYLIVRCEDYSECNVTQVAIGEEVNYVTCSGVNVFLPEGYVTVSAAVADVYGNEASSSISILADRTSPSIDGLAFTGILDGYVLSFSATDGEGSGVAGYSVRVGDSYYCESFGDGNCLTNPDASPGTYSVIVPSLDAGTYSVVVTVYDLAGNSTKGETKLTVIDPASLVAIEGPFFDGNIGYNGWYTSSVSVQYSPLSDVLCTLDGGGVSTSFEVPEEGNHAFICSSGERSVSFFIPIDYTPPTLPSELSYYFTPQLHIDANVYDTVSGVGSITVCLDNNCVDNNYTFPLPSDGNHLVRIIASDIAGNTEEKNYVIAVDSSSFITDLNMPSLITEENVSVSWNHSPLYKGDFIVSLDGNNLACDAPPCEFAVTSGSHTLCVSIAGYSEINKCAEFNADLYPPSVSLSAPAVSRSRSVVVSWNATDDFRVVSALLSVDGAVYPVSGSGSRTLYLSVGAHQICVSAEDAGGRKASRCASVAVRPRRPPRPVPPPPKPIFPRDEIDRIFKQIIDSAHIKYSEVRVLSEGAGHGFVHNHGRIAERVEKEFNVNVVPLYTEWVERIYTVDGKKVIFVQRRLRGSSDRVYEYFEDDVNIHSPYLISLRHGSTLAEFRPENGEYAYIVFGDTVGVPFGPGAPPLPKKNARVEEKGEFVKEKEGVKQPAESVNALEEGSPHSVVTPYAVLAFPSWRAVFAGVLVLAGLVGAILASRKR